MPLKPNRPRSIPLAIAVLLLATLAIGWWHRRSSVEVPSPALRERPIESAPGPPPSASETANSVDRNAATTTGARDLSADERRGGHTLARHVGRTDAELAERLRREPGISAASTYTDRTSAERTVGRVLSDQRERVAAWARRIGNKPNLALDYRGRAGEIIGRTLKRGQHASLPSIDAVVVLRGDDRNGYYVLTSYPEVRR